jgi:hypothetical protein
MSVKQLQKQLMAAIAMVLVAAIALASATYAWFVNNTLVTAETSNVVASTADYLLISDDGSAWGTTMTLDEIQKTLTPVSITNGTLKAATPTFYKVKTNDQNAWKADTSNVTKANVFVAATTDDYYHDTVYLKSSATNAAVKAKLTVTPNELDPTHAEEAMYIAFVPVTTAGNETTYGTPVIYQLAGTNNADTKAGANTYAGDATTDNYTTKGIKSIKDDGTITSNDNMGDLTITNTDSKVADLTFATLATADTSYQYEVYVWMEGTDPQCYNTVAAKTGNNADVSIKLEFYTGDYPTTATTATTAATEATK